MDKAGRSIDRSGVALKSKKWRQNKKTLGTEKDPRSSSQLHGSSQQQPTHALAPGDNQDVPIKKCTQGGQSPCQQQHVWYYRAASSLGRQGAGRQTPREGDPALFPSAPLSFWCCCADREQRDFQNRKASWTIYRIPPLKLPPFPSPPLENGRGTSDVGLHGDPPATIGELDEYDLTAVDGGEPLRGAYVLSRADRNPLPKANAQNKWDDERRRRSVRWNCARGLRSLFFFVVYALRMWWIQFSALIDSTLWYKAQTTSS